MCDKSKRLLTKFSGYIHIDVIYTLNVNVHTETSSGTKVTVIYLKETLGGNFHTLIVYSQNSFDFKTLAFVMH